MARPNPLPEATLPQMLLRHARTRPAAVALRQRDRRTGGWRSITWHDYLDEACDIAGAFSALGLGPGAHIAILAENRVEWVLAQMGAAIVGAVTVGLYPTSSAEEVASMLGHAGVSLVVVENAAQFAKLPEQGQALTVVALDPMPVADLVTDYATLRTRGRAWRASHPGVLEAAIEAQDLDALTLMIFTSGSTGSPKGAQLSYRNIRASAFGLVEPLFFDNDSEILSYLPLCHVAEQDMSVFAPLYGGSCVSFGSGIPALLEDLRDIRPTYFSGVPRIWEKLQAALLPEFEAGGRFGDAAGRDALAFGRTIAFLPEAQWSEAQRQRAAACEAAVWRPARALLGMERLRIATSGAASLVPDVLGFFRAVGFPLRELFGLTENCGLTTLQQSAVIPGTVGELVGAVELRLAEDGEILLRGDSVFVGYYRNPEATAQAKRDGWLHTGDVGTFTDGQLRIVGRKKDIIITSGGKNVAATEVETMLKASPLIEDCILLGEGRNYLAALIQLAVPEGELAEAIADPETERRVAAEIARINARSARVYRVRRAYLLPRKLSHGEGELTATLKVRRFAVYRNHAEEIDAIYAGRLGFDIQEHSNNTMGGRE